MREFRRTERCIYHCECHLVCATKYRLEIINEEVLACLKRKLLEITEHYPRIFFKTMNRDRDYARLLVSIPPQMGVGSAARVIKTNAARGIKEQFPFLKDVYWGTDGIWSNGYFVSTAEVTPEIISRCIENQGREDAGQTTKLFE